MTVRTFAKISRLGTLALFLGLLVGSAAARAQDSVALFESIIKPTFAPDKLTYAKATATGPDSLILTDVVYIPAKSDGGSAPDPINIATVRIDDVDFDAIKRKDAPAHLRLHLEGLASKTASAAQFAELLGPEAGALVKGLDIGKRAANIGLEYKVIGGKELQVREIAFEFPGLLKLRISLDLDGIEPKGDKFSDSSFDNVGLKSGSIVFEDQSFLSSVVAMIAKLESKTEDQVVTDWTAALTLAAANQGEQEVPLANAIAALLKDFRAPKGPLKITFTRPADAKPMKDALAEGLVKTLGAKITYAGETIEPAAKKSP